VLAGALRFLPELSGAPVVEVSSFLPNPSGSLVVLSVCLLVVWEM
jgi:hypothetical protein